MPGFGAIGTQPIGTRYQRELFLVVDDMRHPQRMESPSISQNQNLTVNDMRHEQRMEPVSISQVQVITPEDMRLEQRMDSIFFIEAIDTLQNPPSEDKIAQSSFGTHSVVGTSESPFTLREKTFEFHGERWEGEFEIIPLEHDEMAVWKAWLAVLEGKGRRFYMSPPHPAPRGAVSQNGTVKSITRPRQVTVQGLSASTSDIFLRGDYIQLKDTDQLLMVLEDSGSNGSGEATVTVGPKIRKAPSNGTTVETQSPQGLFQLDTNEPGWQERGSWTELTFSFVEVVHA